MSESNFEHKLTGRMLAAIMFTDIVGYTAIMGENEDKAFELLKRNRQIQKPLIEKFNGKWLKEHLGLLAIHLSRKLTPVMFLE